MKHSFLFLMLTLGMYSINVGAQTKEFRIELDNFEWFLVPYEGLYGAESFNGKTLLPIMFDTIHYCWPGGGFVAKSGNYCAFFNVAGECVIPIERKYKSIQKVWINNDLGTYYVGYEDDKFALCDWKGNEVLTTKINLNNYWIMFASYDEGYFYFAIEDEDSKHYIVNGNGEIIYKGGYGYIDYDEKKKKFFYEDDYDSDKTVILGSIRRVKTTANPLFNNKKENYPQIYAKIGFVPFEGEVTKTVDKLDGKKKYFLNNERSKGIRDLTGKWIVPLCKDYKLLSFGNQKYYLVNNENSKYGLYALNGDRILGMEYDMIEDGGWKYIKVKKNGNLGVFSVDGNEIIPINRNYTSIDKYNDNIKGFAFTKKGYTGICDSQGREISITKLAPTIDDIKVNGGYSYVTAIYDGDTKYYRVGKGGRYGLTDAEGKVIVPTEMEALESAGTGYLRYKLNGFWGLMNYAGKIIIDTDRGYTSIGNFVTFTKRFPYTMNGYKGECDINGRQLSKIKVTTPPQNVASSSNSPSNSSSSTNSNSKSTTGTSTVVVEHHRDPVPVQEWQQCPACYGSGLCPYVQCGGSGWYYIGDKRSTCSRCHGTGKCTTCAGRGGQNVTVYR